MIVTKRLVLRAWRETDVDAFWAICSDPVVMATLGPVMTRAETAALIDRQCAIAAEHGHAFWALERGDDRRLIGWCGAIRGSVGPVIDRLEIGWRLAADCWGNGYASEAARATVDWLFANRADDDVWAITHTGNARSRAVMARLGMQYQPDLDFDHPRLAAGDRLRPHVAYRLTRQSHGISQAKGPSA